MEQITFEQIPLAFTNLFTRIENIEKLLLAKAVSSVEPDQLLTIQSAADLLELSPTTIYALVSRRDIPFMKKGKRLYCSKKELTDWIRSGRKKTTDEIKAEADTYLSLARKKVVTHP